MRCNQVMGLHQEARDFLRKFQEKCFCCEQLIPLKKEVIGHFEGMYENEYPLFRYYLASNFYVDEFVQTTVWDSGPNIYLGLRLSDGREIVWPDNIFDPYTIEEH